VRDREGFAEFVAATLPGLRRLAWGLVGDRHRAEDAVQATLERLYLAWPRLEVRDPVAYARAALVRQIADERRRAWWQREVSTGSVPDRGEIEPALGDVVADRSQLLELLSQLPHVSGTLLSCATSRTSQWPRSRHCCAARRAR
jgi:DNA-directed RNA polymerase specialized sigma24 family protein